MMKRIISRSLVTVIVLACWLQAQTLKKIASIDLPGPKGQRFDYLTMDDEDHWLLSAHLGPGILYVIDVQTNKLVKAIPGVLGITGLEYVPGLRKVYTSDWGEEKIGVVSLKSMNVVKRLDTAAKPNGSTYAAGFHKVYVADTLGKAVAVVDVEKDETIKTLSFKSETGMPQYDSVAKRVYVNLRNTNEVAEIDPATDTVLGTYPVEGCRYNHGMAVDSEHHRAFLLCNGTKTLTVFALDTHKALAHLPIRQGADVVKFDPGLGRIYAACSSGFISIFQEDDVDHYRKLEDFPVQKMVHSLAVDPATHRLYAPEQQENGQPVARMIVYEVVDSAQKH
jgi:DNA-binding beta-propeller fold protein YncE